MERFTIEKDLENNGQWICTDHVRNLVCVFEHGKFNGKKTFISPAGNKHPDYLTWRKLEDEMESWIKSNHPDVI